MTMTTWIQKEITLSAKKRGFHLVTREMVDQCPGDQAVMLLVWRISLSNIHRRLFR